MLARGDKIKEYEIIAPLRSGGMAMLYLARRRGVGGFSRLVALKLVHSHLAVDDCINRLFLQEARIAASVAHPNVVNVEEVGEADGNYFIAMEYVHGVSLAELLASLQKRRLRMSPKLCVWVAAHVAEALHAAHEATGESGLPLHIVHRDVSPQNVLIGHNGHLKLIDFGIAKSPPLSRHATGSGAVLGKLGYMAPEQLRGDPVDRRSDVYALGVMLWEMLTSRNLLRSIHIGDDQDWATRQNPPLPSHYSQVSSPALDRVVAKAIAFEAADRYGGALEFRGALLQAEPPAAEVDAPRFASLMRALLGDELERRRANWPDEVNVELGVNTEATTRGISIDELTSRIRNAEVPDDDDGEEPTMVKESPSWLRLERAVQTAASSGELAAARCAIPTPRLGVPASQLLPETLGVVATRQRLRAVALAVMCVSFGTLPARPANESGARVTVEVRGVSSGPQVAPQAPLAERAKLQLPRAAEATLCAPAEVSEVALARGNALTSSTAQSTLGAAFAPPPDGANLACQAAPNEAADEPHTPPGSVTSSDQPKTRRSHRHGD